MKLIDLANGLAIKYADAGLVEEEVPPTRRYLPKSVAPPSAPRPHDIVAIEHLISTLQHLDLFGRGEASYFFKLVERGESSVHILQMLKSRVDDAQSKLTQCKAELSNWKHHIE